MELVPGSRLGPYEVTARLGAGGMGEVFRARDTRLDRSVAIKVLPAGSDGNAGMRARLEREAKSISQLNHPNICTLHDIGSDAGRTYLVMELVDGETLAARLTRGPLPLHDVLRYGAQIADALDRAHRHGIVHRDLKPANVMITKSGVKLLDFGLAHRAEGAIAQDAPTIQQSFSDAGKVVGTLPYMAPEQLEAANVDHRADVFALGAVLYEMVTGTRAFSAANAVSLIAKILEQDPAPLSEHAAVAPPLLDHVITTCLRKDPDARFQSAADVAHELRWLAQHRDGIVTPVRPRSAGWRGVVWPLIAAIAIAAAGATWLASRSAGASSSLETATFRQLTFDRGDERQPAISPDGKMFAFVKSVSGQRDIFLQRIGGRSPINITNEPRFDDTEPSFSPDGALIAFRSERDGGGIFVMGATGESVRRLTTIGFNPSFSPDGRQIIFAEQRQVDPTFVYGIRNLHVVDLASGATRRFHDGIDVLQPRWSPNGKRVAYWSPTHGTRDLLTIAASGAAASIVKVTNDRATDWSPLWSSDGRFLYFSSDRGGTMNLWRIAVDEESGKPQGSPEPLRTPSTYAGQFSLAAGDERLVYESSSVRNSVVRLDFDPQAEKLSARSEPIVELAMTIRYAAMSPDGNEMAFMGAAPEEDIYIVSADNPTPRQLTDDAARDRGITWTADGTRLLFYSNRTGVFQAYSIRPDGSGLKQLTSHPNGVNFPRYSPDERRIVYLPDAKGAAEIATLRSDGTAGPGTPLPDPPHGRFLPRSWSSDGRFIAGAPYGSRGLILYDTATKKMTDLGIAARTCSFVDDRRILFIDAENRVGLVDVLTRAVRYLGSLPVDAREREYSYMWTDGRTILAVRSERESDIWLMEMPKAK